MNAIYYRSYEEREPVEVRITPQGLAILSFPRRRPVDPHGRPCRRVEPSAVATGTAALASSEGSRPGRGPIYGYSEILRAMRENGSPAPVFETDDDRTSFLSVCPYVKRPTVRRPGKAPNKPPNMRPNKTPNHDAPQVTDHVGRLVAALTCEMSRSELQGLLWGSRIGPHFITSYLRPALEAVLIEMTLPTNQRAATSAIDEPRSARLGYGRPTGRRSA